MFMRKPMKTTCLPLSGPRFSSVFLTAACTLITASTLADTKLITTGSPLKYYVPTNDSLGGAWRSPSFSDSSWASGQNGIGYEVEPGTFNASVIADSQGDFSTL